MENQTMSFANIVSQFLITTMIWSLLDTLPGEWRPVTEAGVYYESFGFVFGRNQC